MANGNMFIFSPITISIHRFHNVEKGNVAPFILPACI